MFFSLDRKEPKDQDKTNPTRLSDFLTGFRLRLENPKIGSPHSATAFCQGLRSLPDLNLAKFEILSPR